MHRKPSADDRRGAEPDEDPYERGFADRLYDDEYDEYEDGYEEDGDAGCDRPVQPRPDIASRRVQQTYTPRRDAPQGHAPRSDVQEPHRAPRRRRRRHRFLRSVLSLLLTLCLLCGAAFAVVYFLGKPPMGSAAGHKKDACTILLAGTDESGDRTDTIMLLHVDRGEKQISLMSIPRDTKVNSTYTPHKINIAYGVNGKGEEGMDSLMDYVADCIGFRPDGYILVELDVFIDLVDLFGGVKFDVPVDMYYEDPSQDLYINLQKGMQTLDGENAMGLVRYRYGYTDADLGRVRVQRDFLMSAISQWVSVKNIYKLPQALRLFQKNALTDLSATELLWLAESALFCGTNDMYLTTVPLYFSDSYVIIDADEAYLDLLNGHFNPYERDVSWDDLRIAY